MKTLSQKFWELSVIIKSVFNHSYRSTHHLFIQRVKKRKEKKLPVENASFGNAFLGLLSVGFFCCWLVRTQTNLPVWCCADALRLLRRWALMLLSTFLLWWENGKELIYGLAPHRARYGHAVGKMEVLFISLITRDCHAVRHRFTSPLTTTVRQQDSQNGKLRF